MQVVDWQIIIKTHGPAVWQAAYKLLGNHADASDCFQETFVDALKVCNRQKIRNFPALLIKLTTSRAIDQLRKRYRSGTNNSLDDYEISSPNKTSDPSNFVLQKELAEKLREAIAQLPEQEAQVFCLRHLNDMSYRQIAKELDIKTNNVGVLIHRAKEKLQKSLSVSSDKRRSEVIL